MKHFLLAFAFLLSGCPKAAPPAPESTATSQSVAAVSSAPPAASVPVATSDPWPLGDGIGAADAGSRVGEAQLLDMKLASGKLESWERVVAGVRGKYRRCYERGLLDEPKAKGKATFTVVVNGINGEVRSADIKGPLPPAVNACLQRVTRNAQFEPSDAGDATLTYTLACTRHVD